MKKTLVDYSTVIRQLPVKKKYTKEELLTEDFLIEKEGNIEIYYAPHNEYLNPEAKVFIIGITPGFEQMSTAMAAARIGLEEGKSISDIQYLCKAAGRFSGSLRKNIISMLDEVGLHEALGLKDSSELFGARDELMHTVSLIPYPVFVKKQNYTGHTPKLIKSRFLMQYIYQNFLEEYNSLNNPDEVLLIPLGKAVEEVLVQLETQGKIGDSQILRGFPHPSGANVNRVVQLEENKPAMKQFIKEKFHE